MFLSLISNAPAVAVAWLIGIVVSLTIHEFSHALMALWLGDKTAEREGRLTLNPLAHLDLIGFIPLLLFGFGWAKPVPFNSYNLKNPKWDSVKIALAGPGANLLLAIIAGIAFRFTSVALGPTNLLPIFLFLTVLLNLFLLFFNVIQIHPLDGSKLFFALFDAPQYTALRNWVAIRGPQVLMIAVFISLLTNFNIFFFISEPAYAVCTRLIGESCAGYMNYIF